MVGISRYCPYYADKSVQISWAEFFYEGTQPKLRHKKLKLAILFRISDLLYAWLFWIQTF